MGFAALYPSYVFGAGHNALTIASSPSVSAAGPGCNISGDLISTMRLLRDRRNVAPARAISNPLGHDLLAAPGGEDHVGSGLAHDIGRNDPVLRGLLQAQLRQGVFAAGDLDQFGHPADA